MTEDKNDKTGLIPFTHRSHSNGSNKGTRDRIKRSPEEEAKTKALAYDLNDYLSSNLLKFQKRNEVVTRINYKMYYLLLDPWLYATAYAKISKNKGALTKGVPEDEELMKWFGQGNCSSIANLFRTNTYTFAPVRRVMIPKPGKKKKRPIDTPTQRDRIVQEALRGILDAVFEPEFRAFEEQTKSMATNYGFRPNKSCFDAVQQLKLHSQQCTYVIEGDIVGAYNNIDRSILLSLVERRIKDKKFLRVLRDLLNSQVLFEKQLTSTVTGTPQGGIVSPLLFNIYMFEFDKFMFERFVKPMNESVSKPQRSPLYQRQGYRMKKIRQVMKSLSIKGDKSSLAYKQLRREYKEIENERLSRPSYTSSSLPKRACFVRYADDWILSFTGTKAEAVKMKEEISSFLETKLKLELDPEKTLISHLQQDGFCFLGFSLKMWSPKQTKVSLQVRKKGSTHTRIRARTTSRNIRIIPDRNRIIRRLIQQGFCNQQMFPIGIRKWALLEPARIVERYDSIMRGIAAYYRECDNHYALNQVSYILLYSCAKTLATRQHITMSQVFSKYGKNLTVKFTKYLFIKSEDDFVHREYTRSFSTYTDHKHSGFMSQRSVQSYTHDPFGIQFYPRTKLKLFSCCCVCNSADNVQLHHINSLRSIPFEKRKDPSYLRMRFNRLQVPVCFKCHQDITHGRFDNSKSVRQFYDEFIAGL